MLVILILLVLHLIQVKILALELIQALERAFPFLGPYIICDLMKIISQH